MIETVQLNINDTKKALEVLAWAKEHCPSYITNTGFENGDGETFYTFYFDNPKDSLTFTLRWL